MNAEQMNNEHAEQKREGTKDGDGTVHNDPQMLTGKTRLLLR